MEEAGDTVYSVPVKSLVATEEDEEEVYFDAEPERVEGVPGEDNDSDQEFGDDYGTESGTSSSVVTPEPVSSTSPDFTTASIPRQDHSYLLKNGLEGVLYHLFLPKRIPDCTQPDLMDIELWILQRVTDIFHDVLRFPKLFPISRMFLSWKATQPKSSFDRDRFAKLFTYQIAKLEHDDTIPLYVRKQNATILFTKQNISEEEHRIKVEIFRPCLPSETIMSTVGSLNVTFPESSNFIYNTKMLSSEVFARQLHELTVDGFHASMSTSIKADMQFVEHREVPDPFLVSDWIVAVLCPTSQYDSPENKISVTKKIRDEINCKRSAQATPFRRSGLWTSIKVALHLKLLQTVGNENDTKIIYKCLLLGVLTEVAQKYGESGKSVHLDLLGQLISKLGRRVRKLQKTTWDKKSPFSEEIMQLWSITLKSVHSVVSSLHEKMKLIWYNECFPSKDAGVIPLITRGKDQFNFKLDLLHDIPWLTDFVEKQGNPIASSLKQITKGKPDKYNKKDKMKRGGQASSPPAVILNGKEGFQERYERCRTYEAILKHKSDIKKLTHLKIWRYDTEQFVKLRMEDSPAVEDNSKAVLDLLLAYVTKTTQPYMLKDNPTGFSQTILVSLQLLQVLDQIATKKYPLLLQYKSGISPGVFDKLVLPHRDDMLLLDSILQYFKDRDKSAQFCRGGVLESVSEEISPTSFACRFASCSEDMTSLKRKILEDMETHIAEKRAQVEKVREECETLQNEIEERKKSCDKCKLKSSKKMPDDDDGDDDGDSTSTDSDSSSDDQLVVKSEKCKKCLDLEKKLEQKRFSVSLYERPFPSEEHLQYAVTFELRIPDEIKHLREALALLKFDLCREQQKKIDTAAVQMKWVNYKSLWNYRTNEKIKKIKAGKDEDEHVALCSRLLSTSSTHHTRIRNPDLLTLSPTTGNKLEETDQFIVPNGMDCVYHYVRRNYFGHDSVNLTKLCTFQVSSTATTSSISADLDGPYSTMQWALDGTTHSQNQAIAEFSSTYHPELIAFGSMRAGHRIQLMNLYRYIANRQLQLEKEPVLALILQTLWEIGPTVELDGGKGEREAHLDFLDNEFVEEFLGLLEQLTETNDTNYANPMILLSIVVITGRILELNEKCRSQCYSLLKKCRSCADAWLEMIQNEISKHDKTHDGGRRDLSIEEEKAERRLIKMQLEISICSALSYNVSSDELFPYVIQDAQDLLHWFQTLSRLHENTQTVEKSQGKAEMLSPFGKQLVEMARQIPLKLNLEGKLSSCSSFKDLFVKCLHVFSCEKWDWGAGAARWELSVEDNAAPNNVIVGKYQTDVITFDLLQGTFLVNGFSRSGIPLNILENHLFEMYFGGQTNKLKVVQSQSLQQTDTHPPVSVVFRTTEKFHGKHYEFELHSRSKVSIREVVEDAAKTTLELLNPDKFRGLLTDELVYMYTQWIDVKKKVVHFRRVPMQDSDYLLPAEFTLHLNSSTNLWVLRDEIHQTYLLSRYSVGFKSIARALSRLELEKFVNVYMDVGEDESACHITAKLPRLHLTFTLENGYLLSKEYKGFKVSSNQNEKGTLIGLQQGLMLDNVPIDSSNASPHPARPLKRTILIPHGKLEIQSVQHHNHQRTTIDLDLLRQPPVFSYEFDPVLKRLKGDKSKSAWLYLAALHGATSSCSPVITDPFTQLTGLEMSVQILQSGFVWSCSPYDEESLFTLRMIKRLAPKRQYYGHGMRSPLRSPRKGMKEEKPPSPIPSHEEQMENTEWPHGLPSMAAYDGYAIIVDKLMEDSERLSVLYPKPSYHQNLAGVVGGSSLKLQMRAYYRHLGAYNKASTIRAPFLSSEGAIGEMALPDVIIHKRKPLGDAEEHEDVGPEQFNLNMLIRVSQARFVCTLEEPMLGSHRKSDLSSYLLTPETASDSREELLLPASPIPDGANGVPLKHLLECELKENWLKFYQMAITWNSSEEGKQAFSLVLNALAYQGAPVGQLLNLHNISVLAESINFPGISEEIRSCSFTDHTKDNDFSEEKLKQFLIERAHSRNPNFPRVDRLYLHGQVRLVREDQPELDKLTTYEGRLEMEDKVDMIVAEVRELWPCEKVPRKKVDEFYQLAGNVWTSHDIKLMNILLTKWYRNYRLKKFIETVEGFLDKFYEHFPNIPKHTKMFDMMKEHKLEINLHPPVQENDNNPFEYVIGLNIEGDLDEPGVIFYSGSAFPETNVETLIPTQREQCLQKIEKYSGRILDSIRGGSSKQIVFMTGLSPRTSPLQLLQYLLHGLRSSSPGRLSPSFLKILGALAVLWTELKRFNRILTLTASKETSMGELTSELQNSGHENWSPSEHPEWLVLELELDLMIRPIQVEVAKQMMKMPGDKNGVMQLNMGEGKTSVIVPMLCCSLSLEPDSLCRVTVLHSIFKTNLNLLSYAIGGTTLARRVYTFPCRRNMEIEVETLDKILAAYQECLKLKGAVLTLPEYRLSFRLLSFDKALKGYPEVGVKFLEIENGLRRYCRDVLDESDELLSFKYQLVYTIGAQITVDGGNLRWNTCQKALQIVQDIAWVYLGKMGSSAVEFDKDLQQRHPEQFACFRLLDQGEEAMEEFRGLVADEFLKEFKLTERQKQLARKLLTQDKISLENFKFVMSMFKNDQSQLDEIRLLAGYLRRGILALALCKRWRVEYGVDYATGETQYRRMAVPFRAKDCPSEKTEFGHPDLAIILTHLSYYYSGLSDRELEECFSALKSKPEAETIYSSWVGRLENIPRFLMTYSGINLEDAYQRINLFSLLRQHKAVIDFWLSHKVFPMECKQFPGKITMSAWDIAYEKQRLPITGFSGTNDSSILLPLPISQQDLQQLHDTNRKMEAVLLQPENGNHKGFQMGVTCKLILEEMKKESNRVLIDAGALMLECDNEQVAQLWLEVDPEIEAVVYFNRDNDLVVKCRSAHGTEADDGSDEIKKKKHGRRSYSKSPRRSFQPSSVPDIPIEISPYRDRLEKCGVFLDDQHTRGTDLKFPVGSKACVTIGSRMRRDKLMQACMRMRQLGSGHSVTFYLSHEASSKVTQDSVGGITTQNVLKWVAQNTKEHNHEGLVYWAIAGKNYAQKLAAQEFHDTVDTHELERIYCLARQCVDDEVLLLKDMYGTYTEAELLSKLIPEWFEITQRKLQTVEGCYSLSQRITRRYDSIRDGILKRIDETIPDKTYLTGGLPTMEEEQEKEIEKESEMETEEERQIILPNKLDFVEHPKLHENVRKIVLQGQKITLKTGISRLADIFEKTSFWKLVQPECWAKSEVYATNDFISVVKPFEKDDENHFKTDAHLRPVEYIISVRSKPIVMTSPSTLSFKKNGSGGTPSPTPLQILILSPFEVNELMPYFRQGKAQSQLHMFSPRYFQAQSLLANTASLQVPRPQMLQSLDAPLLIHIIPDESKCLAALHLASGNLYFASMDEQKTFAKFLGLVPRPWSAEQMNAFEKEMIKKTGFLLPKFRNQQMDCCQIEQDAFQKDPSSLVKKILMCRHTVVSDVAHVSRLLNHNWYVDI